MDASVASVVRALARNLRRVDAGHHPLPSQASRGRISIAATRDLWTAYITAFTDIRNGLADSALPADTSCEALPTLAAVAVPL